jgi:hypothetical protein
MVPPPVCRCRFPTARQRPCATASRRGLRRAEHPVQETASQTSWTVSRKESRTAHLFHSAYADFVTRTGVVDRYVGKRVIFIRRRCAIVSSERRHGWRLVGVMDLVVHGPATRC